MPLSNTDLTEGKGAYLPLGYFESRWDAMKAGKGKSVQGTDCRIEEVPIIDPPKNSNAPYGMRYYGPVVVTPASKEGATRDEIWQEHQDAIEKAKAAGLDEDTIYALQSTGGRP